MARSRRNRTDADLRSRILEATEQLLVDTTDERKVSISAITQAVQCTPPSVYYYWPDKDALIREVCRRRFAEFTASQDAATTGITDPVDALRARGLAYFDYGLAHPEHYRVLFMTRPDTAGGPGNPSGAGEVLPRRATGADRDTHGNRSEAGDGLPELPAAAGQSLKDLVATVRACVDAGRFARRDPVTVAVSLWSIVHGATSLAISNPAVPPPFLRSALELAFDATCRGLADLHPPSVGKS